MNLKNVIKDLQQKFQKIVNNRITIMVSNIMTSITICSSKWGFSRESFGNKL